MAQEGLQDEEELQRWFIERMGQYLASKGKTIIGWDEILEGGLPEGAAVQSWRGMGGLRLEQTLSSNPGKYEQRSASQCWRFALRGGPSHVDRRVAALTSALASPKHDRSVEC